MKISDRIRNVMALAGIGAAASKELQVIAGELDAAERPKWFWGRPTKPGLYAFGGVAKEGPVTQWGAGTCTDGLGSPDSWLAYLSPIPEIDPPSKPKKYDTPILPRDAGEECEFSDDGFKTFVVGKLQAYDTALVSEWVMEWQATFDYCRIEVTE